MALGRLKVWAVGELLKSTDLNAEFDNLIASILAINPQATQSITPDLLADGANPEVFFGEIFFDTVVLGTGLAPLSNTGLTITVGQGTAYILETTTSPQKLIRVAKASSTVVNVPNNTVGFIDLGVDGVFDISTNASGAAADHVRLISFTTDATVVTVGPTDIADRQFLESFKFPNLVEGLLIEVTDVTTGTIFAGATVRDSTNEFNLVVDSDLAFDITTTGAGGRDQGSENSSTWYALLVIDDSLGIQPQAALLVDDINFPGSIILPSGYNIFRRVGRVRNDSSSDLLIGQQVDSLFTYYDHHIVSAAFVQVNFTDIDASGFVPKSARSCQLGIESAAANNSSRQLFVAEAGRTTATGGVLIFHLRDDGGTTTVDAASNKDNVALSSTQRFAGRTLAGAAVDSIRVAGYRDRLND